MHWYKILKNNYYNIKSQKCVMLVPVPIYVFKLYHRCQDLPPFWDNSIVHTVQSNVIANIS